MKVKTLTATLLLGITLSSFVFVSQPSNAQTVKYYCDKSSDGVPTTFAKIATGQKIAIIRWEKRWSRKLTPEYRCQQVSAKFQNAYNAEALNFLTTGTVNRQTMICAAKLYNDPCKYPLFTLRPDENPSEVIEYLRQWAPITGGPISQTYGENYIDMNRLLREKKPESEN